MNQKPGMFRAWSIIFWWFIAMAITTAYSWALYLLIVERTF